MFYESGRIVSVTASRCQTPVTALSSILKGQKYSKRVTVKHNPTHRNCSAQRATSQRQKNKQETCEGLWSLVAPTLYILPVFSTYQPWMSNKCSYMQSLCWHRWWACKLCRMPVDRLETKLLLIAAQSTLSKVTCCLISFTSYPFNQNAPRTHLRACQASFPPVGISLGMQILRPYLLAYQDVTWNWAQPR